MYESWNSADLCKDVQCKRNQYCVIKSKGVAVARRNEIKISNLIRRNHHQRKENQINLQNLMVRAERQQNLQLKLYLWVSFRLAKMSSATMPSC